VGELLKITDLLNDALNTKQVYEDESFAKLETNLTYKVLSLFQIKFELLNSFLIN